MCETKEKAVSRSWDSGLCNVGLNGNLGHGVLTHSSSGHGISSYGTLGHGSHGAKSGYGTIGSYKKIYWTGKSFSQIKPVFSRNGSRLTYVIGKENYASLTWTSLIGNTN